ncbi:hypothetical protein KY343_01150 [Candidatus Woesearchaeota archaeon]|nr:hypothetical protein [Candidatus Woesearchaeota archaeon]
MKLIKTLTDALSAAYKSTALKVGGILLAGSIFSGCLKEYFTGYCPPKAWQTQISLSEDSFGIRGQGNFNGTNSSIDADITHNTNETVIEPTGSSVEESETVLDVNIKPKNDGSLSIRPVIATSGLTVTSSAGQMESDLESTLLSADLLWRFGATNRVLARLYGKDSTEKMPIVGDTETTQRGIYIESSLGMFLPLLSYETNKISLGGSTVDAKELQAGTSLWMNAGENIMGSVGAYAVFTDDGTEKETKVVVPASLELKYGKGVLGFDGTFDGTLTSLGVHGCFGGDDLSKNVREFSRFINRLQSLNYLERGVPASLIKNRRFDLSRDLERNLDTRLFYFVGARQEQDMDGNIVVKPYAYIGVPFSTKGGKKVNIGATYGPFAVVFAEDIVRSQGGVIGNIQLNDSSHLYIAVQRYNFENRRDTTRYDLGLLIPLK